MQTNETTNEAATVVEATAPAAPVAAKPSKPTRKTAKAKAAAKQAKAKPAAKLAKPNKAEAARNAERERCLANAAIVRPHYSGPSLATHASRAPKLADALARIAKPIQRAKNPTERDESGLLLCFRHADANGCFDPVAATADLGMLSRIASLGFIVRDGQRAKLTADGISRAKLLAKRNKAKAA